ncbi:MAG: hypothetical protein HN531_09125 [Opitutae bacterium]|nr:hypothetical protein [Opitutae bacterium]
MGAGQSIQSAVNGAANGDTIVLTAPADYDGNVTIAGKALRIVSLHRNNHDVTGSITISAVPAGQSVTFKNLSVSGPVSASDSNLNLLRCTMGQEVNATNPGNANTQLAVVQSNLSGKLRSTLTRTWVGYSDLRQSYFEGQVEIVGNIFDGENLGGIGIDLNGSSTMANVHNNIVQNYSGTYDFPISNECIGIKVDGQAKVHIKNNFIYNCYDFKDVGTEYFSGIGIYIKDSSACSISSNQIWNNFVQRGHQNNGNYVEFGNVNIWADSSVRVEHNSLVRHNDNLSEVRGGAINLYSIVSSQSQSHTHFLVSPSGLMSQKAGKDAGSPKDADKDHDGSRNDIGPNGGRNYIPNGRTTDKAIPISFSIAPQAVQVGGTVTIESTGATVK